MAGRPVRRRAPAAVRDDTPTVGKTARPRCRSAGHRCGGDAALDGGVPRRDAGRDGIRRRPAGRRLYRSPAGRAGGLLGQGRRPGPRRACPPASGGDRRAGGHRARRRGRLGHGRRARRRALGRRIDPHAGRDAGALRHGRAGGGDHGLRCRARPSGSGPCACEPRNGPRQGARAGGGTGSAAHAVGRRAPGGTDDGASRRRRDEWKRRLRPADRTGRCARRPRRGGSARLERARAAGFGALADGTVRRRRARHRRRRPHQRPDDAGGGPRTRAHRGGGIGPPGAELLSSQAEIRARTAGT